MIVHKNWVINFVLSVMTVATCWLGDLKLRRGGDPLPKAICDSSTHGLVGLFTSAIILTECSDKLYLAIACMLIASLIDVDHFITARSFKLSVRNFPNES
jgi:hypothetical protein